MLESRETTVDLPQTLLWAEYPDGRYGAVVQSDGNSVYFAVQRLTEEHGGVGSSRWVWVRNLRPAPLLFPETTVDAHRLPLVPESYCHSPQGQGPLDLDHTQIVWFEQGIGAALIDATGVLAILPPQSPRDNAGTSNLPGFAKDCRRACSVAIPLEDDDLYVDDVPALQAYWQSWKDGSPAADWHQTLHQSLATHSMELKAEFATINQSWPPLKILHYSGTTGDCLITSGGALRCQPLVEREVLNYREHQRIELAIELPENTSATNAQEAAAWLAGIARYPWYHETCFLPGHTLATTAIYNADQHNTGSTRAILSELQVAKHQRRKAISLPNFRQQPVNLLWLNVVDRSVDPQR